MAKHEYRILSRNTQGALATVVESFLDGGWQLAGGVVIRDEKEYVQAEGYDPVEEVVTKFYQTILRTTYAPSLAKEAVMDHATGEVTYSEN